MKKAVVLLSGGLDSAVVLASVIASKQYLVTTLSFDYGQRHGAELGAAAAISCYYQHTSRITGNVLIELDKNFFRRSGSSLTNNRKEIPTNRSEKEMANGIPSSYVPGRNTIFLSHALSYAEANGANEIYIGANALDYSGYPDCRPDYIEAFERMANLAIAPEARPIEVNAPLISLHKKDIIKLGTDLGVPFELTVSCYQASDLGWACGKCDSCILRKKGFEAAKLPDPTRYV